MVTEKVKIFSLSSRINLNFLFPQLLGAFRFFCAIFRFVSCVVVFFETSLIEPLDFAMVIRFYRTLITEWHRKRSQSFDSDRKPLSFFRNGEEENATVRFLLGSSKSSFRRKQYPRLI